jgi:hypothetical protein
VSFRLSATLLSPGGIILRDVILIGKRSTRACVVVGTLGLLVSASPAIAAEGQPKASLDATALEELAPMLLQIINLSALDPGFAAGMVPETWVEAAVDGALLVESESASVRAHHPAAAQMWPIGPWQSSASLAASIQSVQPGAVVGLYKALRPRLEAECRRREVDATGCERAIKVTASRLSASSVVAHAARPGAVPLTPTQAAISNLGEPAADALRKRIRAVGTTLWGPPRAIPRSRKPASSGSAPRR